MRPEQMLGTQESTAFVPSILAATATEVHPIFRAPFACIIPTDGVNVVPQADVTGDDTNTKYLNIQNRGSAGTGTTEIGHLDLATGVDLVDFDSKNIPLTAAVTLAAGDVLAVQVEKVGTGVLLPNLHFVITYKPAGV